MSDTEHSAEVDIETLLAFFDTNEDWTAKEDAEVKTLLGELIKASGHGDISQWPCENRYEALIVLAVLSFSQDVEVLSQLALQSPRVLALLEEEAVKHPNSDLVQAHQQRISLLSKMSKLADVYSPERVSAICETLDEMASEQEKA